MKKKRNQPDSVRNQILAALRTCGPMTRAEIERECKLPPKHASAFMVKLMEPNLHRCKRPKLVYISDWVYVDAASGRRYLRPVYALGDLPDKGKPRNKIETKKEANARYWQRRKMKLGAGASVFHFAMSQAKGGLKDVIKQFSTHSELAA